MLIGSTRSLYRVVGCSLHMYSSVVDRTRERNMPGIILAVSPKRLERNSLIASTIPRPTFSPICANCRVLADSVRGPLGVSFTQGDYNPY